MNYFSKYNNFHISQTIWSLKRKLHLAVFLRVHTMLDTMKIFFFHICQ